MPQLPGKFGFALDAGLRPVLTKASADIRVERAADGRLILRPDGHPLGQPVTDLGQDAVAMANWFIANGGITNGRGRMSALIARGTTPPNCTLAPAEPLPTPSPGLHADGALVALAFGQMQAETLNDLATLGTACTGAPACPQARGDTRILARHLAPHVPTNLTLHISGCPKGCAHPGVAETTLTATGTGYDLIRNGTASDTPILTGLTLQAIKDHLKALNASHL